MPRPRKPTELLQLSGAFKHDPQRTRDVGAKSPNPLGPAPRHLNDAEKSCWKEVVGNSAAGILTSADRLTIEMLSRLLAKFRADWLTGAEMSIMKNLLTELGWTPASRSKVAAPQKDSGPDFSEFLN